MDTEISTPEVQYNRIVEVTKENIASDAVSCWFDDHEFMSFASHRTPENRSGPASEEAVGVKFWPLSTGIATKFAPIGGYIVVISKGEAAVLTEDEAQELVATGDYSITNFTD